MTLSQLKRLDGRLCSAWSLPAILPSDWLLCSRKGKLRSAGLNGGGWSLWGKGDCLSFSQNHKELEAALGLILHPAKNPHGSCFRGDQVSSIQPGQDAACWGESRNSLWLYSSEMPGVCCTLVPCQTSKASIKVSPIRLRNGLWTSSSLMGASCKWWTP